MLKAKSIVSILFLIASFYYEAQSYKQVPEWSKDAVMYELNVRQFSSEGTFEAIYDELPRLKKMGIDIIWLMPIHPIGELNRKGSKGSYYAVKDYKKINPFFGNESSFKKLVQLTHDQGMKLIIDWVANHTSPDNIWIEQGHLNWYTLDSIGGVQPPPGTDWWDVSDLNYDNMDMRSAMIDAMEYWVREFDIDGYRCDVAGWVPVDFWNDARKALDKIKPVFMLAEDEGEKLHDLAFDMTYGWEFHHIMNEVAKKHMNADSIIAYFDRERKRFASNAYRLHFTSNHDENSWNGTEYERMVKELSALLSFHQLYTECHSFIMGKNHHSIADWNFLKKIRLIGEHLIRIPFTIHCSILRRKIQHYGMEILAPFLNSSKQETQMCCFLNESRETTVSLDCLTFLSQGKM